MARGSGSAGKAKHVTREKMRVKKEKAGAAASGSVSSTKRGRMARGSGSAGKAKRVKKEGAAPGKSHTHACTAPIMMSLHPCHALRPDDDSQQNYLDMQPKFHGVDDV